MTDADTRRRPLAHEAHFTALDLKSVGADGAFEGYASVFNREDMGRDVVAPGAFRDTLEERGAAGVRMLFQHDPGQPIGVWTRLQEDRTGLYAIGRLNPDVARAREVMSLMREGAIDGLSIGFKAVKARRDPRTRIRRIERIDLWEISVVTFPMLPEARIARTKGWTPPLATERDFERWLTRDARLTRAEARALMRTGLKGVRDLRDAVPDAIDKALSERLRAATRLIRQ